MQLSKTNYLIYRDCPHSAWVKVHEPEVYSAKPLSLFDQSLLETGRDVDELARDLFPSGVTVARGDRAATLAHIASQAPVIYQGLFETAEYTTACDMLVWNADGGCYDLYEVKSSTSDAIKGRDELYTHDLAFQVEVLRQCGMRLGRCYVVRLNTNYVRGGELDLTELFATEDFTERVRDVANMVVTEMTVAHAWLQRDALPPGPCTCIYRGRSNHCTTFSYTNPEVPEYSVHDIARIGSSKVKLQQLVDGGVLAIEDVDRCGSISGVEWTRWARP